MTGDEDGGYASPPCYGHEVDPTYFGAEPAPDPQQAIDVARWRKAQRERLTAARLSIPADQRADCAGRMAADLDRLIPAAPERIVSVYWPFRGEPDLRHWMERAHARGLRIALPVVAEKDAPLLFREWRPGARMERGALKIPVPADGEEVTPEVVIAPLVGYDRQGYRLGNGGGYFDRTLAALSPRPLVIGVGLRCAELPTIYPQAHDIAMDWIVTGEGPPLRRGGRSGEI